MSHINILIFLQAFVVKRKRDQDKVHKKITDSWHLHQLSEYVCVKWESFKTQNTANEFLVPTCPNQSASGKKNLHFLHNNEAASSFVKLQLFFPEHDGWPQITSQDPQLHQRGCGGYFITLFPPLIRLLISTHILLLQKPTLSPRTTCLTLWPQQQ